MTWAACLEYLDKYRDQIVALGEIGLFDKAIDCGC